MTNRETTVGNEYLEKMTPKEVFEYIAKLGDDVHRQALTNVAMLEAADDKSIAPTLTEDGALSKFKPGGDIEKSLIKITSELISIGSNLYQEGVHMTESELKERLDKMKSQGY